MFDYDSPVKALQDEISMRMENEIMKAVCRVGVTVDKEELLKALKYDRGQYEKGYQDGVNERECGEWVKQETLFNELYKCSLCGAYAGRICNFCPDCGADMRKQV